MQQIVQHVLLAASPQADQACGGVAAAGGSCGSGTEIWSNIQTISNTLIFVVGAIAVIMVIVGGLRYVLSNGDSAGLKSAKDTILYSLVGVVVALIAYALVSFVISRFAG